MEALLNYLQPEPVDAAKLTKFASRGSRMPFVKGKLGVRFNMKLESVTNKVIRLANKIVGKFKRLMYRNQKHTHVMLALRRSGPMTSRIT